MTRWTDIRRALHQLLALEAERAHGEVSYLDCFSNGEGRHAFRTWTGIFLQAMQQLTVSFVSHHHSLIRQLSSRMVFPGLSFAIR